MIDYRKIRAIIREFLKVYQTLEKPNRDYVKDQMHMSGMMSWMKTRKWH